MTKQKRQKADPDLLARFLSDVVLSLRLMLDRRVGVMTKLIPVVMIGYILSPLDLIPDLLLPFGVMDDIGALLLGLQFFIRSAPPGVVDEYRRGRSESVPRQGTFEPNEPKVIEGFYEVKDDNR
jgi:uncharacterized membrane protein YkvA (DUF1232 family)